MSKTVTTADIIRDRERRVKRLEIELLLCDDAKRRRELRAEKRSIDEFLEVLRSFNTGIEKR